MRKIIKLAGHYNDLELGYVEDGVYHMTGLLEDRDHTWKILAWIDQNLEDGHAVKATKECECMMEASQRKNKEALDKIVAGAFRHSK